MKKLTFHRTTPSLAVALQGYEEETLSLFLVVYHRGHRARVRPFGTGFQPTPWRCSKCRRIAYADDLRYDFASSPIAKKKKHEKRSTKSNDKNR